MQFLGKEALCTFRFPSAAGQRDPAAAMATHCIQPWSCCRDGIFHRSPGHCWKEGVAPVKAPQRFVPQQIPKQSSPKIIQLLSLVSLPARTWSPGWHTWSLIPSQGEELSPGLLGWLGKLHGERKKSSSCLIQMSHADVSHSSSLILARMGWSWCWLSCRTESCQRGDPSGKDRAVP